MSFFNRFLVNLPKSPYSLLLSLVRRRQVVVQYVVAAAVALEAEPRGDRSRISFILVHLLEVFLYLVDLLPVVLLQNGH